MEVQKDGVFGSGDSFVSYDFLPPDLSEDLFYKVKEEVKWNTMCQNGGVVPRLIAIQGTTVDGAIPMYRHPVDEQPVLTEWTPQCGMIKTEVGKRLGQCFNHALIQYYRDGHDFIGEHSDKTLDILHGSPIVNYTLGATRVLILKRKVKGADGLYEKQRVRMRHNSVFVLGPETNREWYHSIRQDKRLLSEKSEDELAFGGQRISLTLRTIATFYKDGRLMGQGARAQQQRTEEGATEEDTETEAQLMLTAFGEENHRPDFDWERSYGRGFDVLNFKVLSSTSKT